MRRSKMRSVNSSTAAPSTAGWSRSSRARATVRCAAVICSTSAIRIRRASAATLDELKGAPVLTVGDGDDFARNGGMIGLFVEDGRMRFAINPDAAHRAGLRLSSQLLKLAKIVKEGRHGRTVAAGCARSSRGTRGCRWRGS